MRRAFVIGHPIAHSRSPRIHGHWLARYGIDGSYEAIDVAPADLPAFLERIRAGEFVGGNVTVPLKELAYELCDTRDLDTADIGATNTLTTYETDQGIAIHGNNTDHYGFLANLDAAVPGWNKLRSAIVIGAGGSARGVVSALVHRGIPAIHILNRTVEKARSLADDEGAPHAAPALRKIKAAVPRPGQQSRR
jgi:shikimate dehydrogenase